MANDAETLPNENNGQCQPVMDLEPSASNREAEVANYRCGIPIATENSFNSWRRSGPVDLPPPINDGCDSEFDPTTTAF